MRFWHLSGVGMIGLGALGLSAGSGQGMVVGALLGACITLFGGAAFWGFSRLFRSSATWVRCASALVTLSVASIPLSLVMRLCEPRHGGGQVFSPAFAGLTILPAMVVAVVFGAGFGQDETPR